VRTILSHSPPLAQLDNTDDPSCRPDFTVLGPQRAADWMKALGLLNS
jgi:hypothetical protein